MIGWARCRTKARKKVEKKEGRKGGRNEERRTSGLGFHLQEALESKHRLERNLERNQLDKGLYLDNRRPCTEGLLQGISTQHQQSGLLPWVALPVWLTCGITYRHGALACIAAVIRVAALGGRGKDDYGVAGRAKGDDTVFLHGGACAG